LFVLKPDTFPLPAESPAMPRPKPDLDALRAQIAALEKRPVLAEGAALAAGRQSHSNEAQGIAAAMNLLAAPRGLLHEVFADKLSHAGTALGFALGLARPLLSGERRALIYLQLVDEIQELGLPYAIGLKQFGLDTAALVIGRMDTVSELLWAMEEAVACRAVAGVIVDFAVAQRSLDFTVSRRLSLRTAASGTSAFLLRYEREREATAAKLRWHVSPALSGDRPRLPRAPQVPRFAVRIEKGRLGSKTQRIEGARLLLDWTENGFVAVERFPRRLIELHPAPALPRAVPSLLGDRLSKAG
jgi:protein ImuA